MTNLKNLFKSIILSACVMIACLTCEDRPYDPPPPRPITFEKVIGGPASERAYSVEQTRDGGYIIGGYISNPGFHALLVKTNAYGDTEWVRTYTGGDGRDAFGCTVRSTSDGGYIMTGFSTVIGSGNVDMLLLKTDSEGDALWTSFYDRAYSDAGSDVLQTNEGYVVVGNTVGADGGPQVFVVKTNSLGDTVWTRSLRKGNGTSIIETSGGFVISAYGPLSLSKIDVNGNLIWGKTYDTTVAGGRSVQQTQDFGLIVTGGSRPPGHFETDIYLIKTDANGDTLWTRSYGGSDYEYGTATEVEGGFMIVGTTDSYGLYPSNIYFVRTNSTGDTLWTKTMDGPLQEKMCDFRPTPDNGLIVVGETHDDPQGFSDILLLKTDSLARVFVEK